MGGSNVRRGMRFVRTPKSSIGTGAQIFFACITMLAGCGEPKRSAFETATTLRRSLTGDPASLDPQKAGDTYSFEVLRDLYEGLTSEGATGLVEPALAERWDASSDGLEYRFYLRGDAHWSDGSAVVADDVVNGMRRAVDQKTVSPQAALLRPIVGVEEALSGHGSSTAIGVRSEGPRVVVIRLRAPVPYLPSILANAVAFPFRRATANGPQLFNGPYVVADRRLGSWILLRKNPGFSRFSANSPFQVRYSILPDARTTLRLFEAGELDLTSTVPVADIEKLRVRHPKELQLSPQYSVVYYTFNLAEGPLAKDGRVRRALSMAIDRDMIASKLLGAGETPAYGYVPQGIGGYFGPQYSWKTSSAEQRITEARALIDASGHGTNKPVKIRLIFSEDDAVKKVAIAVASMWRQSLGVEVDLIPMEYKSLLAMRSRRSEWDVLAQGWNADFLDPQNFLDVFTCGSPQNDPKYCDARFDADLNGANSDSAEATRQSRLTTAESRLLDAYAVAPLYFASTHRLVSARVEGAVPNPMNHNFSRDLRLKQ